MSTPSEAFRDSDDRAIGAAPSSGSALKTSSVAMRGGLSLGERQLVVLAMALAQAPRVLILDEQDADEVRQPSGHRFHAVTAGCSRTTSDAAARSSRMPLTDGVPEPSVGRPALEGDLDHDVGEHPGHLAPLGQA